MQDLIAKMVNEELRRALAKHGSMTSAHEAYAVVKEEFDEWWAMIMSDNRDPLHREKATKELIQMAAMCHRALLDVYMQEVLAFETHGYTGAGRER